MKYISIALIGIFLASCTSKKKAFEVKDFQPFANFQYDKDTLVLPSDLSDAVIQGICIPSARQCKEGYFKVAFSVRNTSEAPQAYRYKIYYQNETYKFLEYSVVNNTKVYNPLSAENFYGSWDDPKSIVHETPVIPNDGQFHVVTDSIRINGNPRDEKKYYGGRTVNVVTEDKIKALIGYLKSNPDAMKDIKDKALKEERTIDEQLFLDALWIIKYTPDPVVENNRWKRNPRMGNYNFMLVVGTADGFSKLPDHVKDINTTKDSSFINPYYYYLYSGRCERDISIVQSNKILKTTANLNLGSGISVDVFKYQTNNTNESYFNAACNTSKELQYKAQFEQFFHYINRKFKLKNIPVIADVNANEYTQEDYNRNLALYKVKGLPSDYIKVTDCPCKTVKSDSVKKALTLTNPGNGANSYRKENVAVNSRIGFTYGKYIAKIKFPPIINNSNMWNGLTCAFWLLFQSEADWNRRRICDNAGYIPKYDNNNGAASKRVSTLNYSEIDFEIIKTSQYWPITSYPDKSKYKIDDPKSNKNIIVTCTNWDMACKSPKIPTSGAVDFTHNNQGFVIHRWDEWYKALTSKYEIAHDSIFGQSYYYEIDWYPDRIVWSIGKTKDKMHVVGAMDATVTSVPNNQMIMIFSQEYHDTEWWPLSPFSQNYVPFPKNDIVGEIEEVEIQ